MDTELTSDILKDIEITDLQCTACHKRYLICWNDNYFETNELTAQLLAEIKEAPTPDCGIRHFVSKHSEYSYTQIAEMFFTRLLPELKKKGDIDAKFLYQRTLLSAESLETISTRLSFLFKPYVMMGLSIAAIIAIAYFFLANGHIKTFAGRIDATSIISLILFIIFSSVFHELGHASATRYYGLQHGNIGLGLYFNFPVLYTDVSAVWELPVRQRCVVNIAGVYFQAILLIFLIFFHSLTDSELIKYLILTMCFGFLLTLNPFFKFDGYWLATDLLGVPNLRRRTRELLRYYLVRLSGHRTTRPHILETKGAVKLFIIMYSVILNLFMCYYFFVILPQFMFMILGDFPNEVRELIICLSNRIMPPFALMRNIFSQLLFMALIAYMIYRIVTPRIQKIARKYAAR